jgi:hypothetical protein
MADSWIPEGIAAFARGLGNTTIGTEQNPDDLTQQPTAEALGRMAGNAVMLSPLGLLPGRAGKIAAMGGGALMGSGVGEAYAQATKGSGQPDPVVLDMQQRLKALGLYKGKIDGSTGPDTKKAFDEFKVMGGIKEGEDAFKALRMATDPEFRAAEEGKAAELANTTMATKRAEADAATAATKQAEIGRKNKLDQDAKTAEEQANSWLTKAWQFAPHVIGIAGGALGARYLNGKFNTASEKNAKAVDDFAKTAFTSKDPVTMRNVSERAGNVNSFYANGGGEAPFAELVTSGELANKRAWANGKTPPAPPTPTPINDLYRQDEKAAGVFGSAGRKDLMILGGAGIDYGAMNRLEEHAKEDADKAREDFKGSQLSSDIERAVKAQNQADFYNFMGRAAVPFAASYLISGKFNGRKPSRPGPGSFAAADAERMRVQQFANQTGVTNPTPKKPPPGPQGGPPAPVPPPAAPVAALPPPAAPAAPQGPGGGGGGGGGGNPLANFNFANNPQHQAAVVQRRQGYSQMVANAHQDPAILQQAASGAFTKADGKPSARKIQQTLGVPASVAQRILKQLQKNGALP